MVPRPLPHLVCSMDTQQACARLGSFVAHHGPRSGRTGIPGALVFRSSSVKSTLESKGDMGSTLWRAFPFRADQPTCDHSACR